MKEYYNVTYADPPWLTRCIRFAICRASARFEVRRRNDLKTPTVYVCGRHLQMVLENRLDENGRLGNNAT